MEEDVKSPLKTRRKTRALPKTHQLQDNKPDQDEVTNSNSVELSLSPQEVNIKDKASLTSSKTDATKATSGRTKRDRFSLEYTMNSRKRARGETGVSSLETRRDVEDESEKNLHPKNSKEPEYCFRSEVEDKIFSTPKTSSRPPFFQKASSQQQYKEFTTASSEDQPNTDAGLKEELQTGHRYMKDRSEELRAFTPSYSKPVITPLAKSCMARTKTRSHGKYYNDL